MTTTKTIAELAAKHSAQVRDTADLYISTYGIDGMDGMALALINIVLGELDAMDYDERQQSSELYEEVDALDSWRDAFDAYLCDEVELGAIVSVM